MLGAALVLLAAAGVALVLGKSPGAGARVISPSPATGDAPQPSSPSVKAATVGHAPYPVVQAENGVVRLPLATFDDGKAHHYTYVYNGKPLEFFVLKSADGTVRAAFNACDVCYPFKKGYRQEGDEVVCNNCGRRFPADQINVVQGGCNPSPLNRAVDGDMLVIQAEDIAAGIKYF
ncbi:MAG: DUF2318 domain-containing protein [Chloroflexi bacterium]|nr:DUF2318 domain-containing protein [Chloroflexota bacterium]